MAKFEKGNTLGKGRPKGSKNALTKKVKEDLLNYLNDSVPDMIECIESMKFDQRFSAYIQIANLVLPKEKSIDMTVDSNLLKQPIVIDLGGADPTQDELNGIK